MFMIKPRTKCRGDLDPEKYNKNWNSINRNFQHKNDFYAERIVVTPLRFENISSDGVHPRFVGRALLRQKIFEIVASFLATEHHGQ